MCVCAFIWPNLSRAIVYSGHSQWCMLWWHYITLCFLSGLFIVTLLMYPALHYTDTPLEFVTVCDVLSLLSFRFGFQLAFDLHSDQMFIFFFFCFLLISVFVCLYYYFPLNWFTLWCNRFFPFVFLRIPSNVHSSLCVCVRTVCIISIGYTQSGNIVCKMSLGQRSLLMPPDCCAYGDKCRTLG